MPSSKLINRKTYGALVSPTALFLKATADGTIINEAMQKSLSYEALNGTKEAVVVTKEPNAASAKSLSDATLQEIFPIPLNIYYMSNNRTGDDIYSAIQEKSPISQEKVGDSTNLLGIVSVWRGLYWLERQNIKKAKEDAMKSLKEQPHGKRLDVKEQVLQQFRKLKQGMEATTNELFAAKTLAGEPQNEMGNEKTLSEILGKQIQSLQIVLEKMQNQKEMLESKLTEEENKAIQLQVEKKKLKLELDKKAAEVDTLRSVLKEKEQIYKDLGSQLKAKLEALSQIESKVEDLIKEIFSANQKLSLIETAVQELQGKLAPAHIHGTNLKKRCTSVTENFESARKSSAREITFLQLEVNFYVVAVGDITQNLNACTKDSESIKEIISELQVEIDLSEKEVIISDDQLEQSHVLSDQLEGLEASHEQMKKELAVTDNSTRAIQAALEKEKEVSASTAKQLESARESIAEDVGKAKSESDKVIKAANDLERKLGAAKIKIAELEAGKSTRSMSLGEETKVSEKLKGKVKNVFAAEKDNSTLQGKNLEGELASAKGGRLCLQKQVTLTARNSETSIMKLWQKLIT